jgi:hypothetical protein
MDAPQATHARVDLARTRPGTAALAVGGAVLAALTVWLAAVPLGGMDLVVRPPGRAAQAIGPGAVLAMSLGASLAAWALLAILERLAARGRVIWTVVAAVVLVASLLPVLTVEAGAGTRLVLVLMHALVGLVLIGVLGARPGGGGQRR